MKNKYKKLKVSELNPHIDDRFCYICLAPAEFQRDIVIGIEKNGERKTILELQLLMCEKHFEEYQEKK
jgi:hypothetical protein